MAGEMFGAPVGVSKAEADLRARELHELALAQGDVELKKAKLDLGAQEQMINLMKGISPESRTNPASSQGVTQSYNLSEKMNMLSEIAMQSGLPEKAREYAVAGSTIRKNADDINKNRLESAIKHAELLSGLMANVTDERSWKSAISMFEMQTGQKTPWSQVPFTPEALQQVKTGAMSMKDKALTEAAKARTEASKAMVAERQARLPLIKAQTDLANQRTAKLAKEGAVGKIPKSTDIKSITDLMVRDYGFILPEEARVKARPVAERMLDIIKEQKVNASEAANRAYQEYKAAGHFTGIRERVFMSGTKENPIDIPMDGKKLNTAKLKKNLFYKGTGSMEGKTLLWTGSNFVVAEAASPDEDEILSEDELDEDMLEEEE